MPRVGVRELKNKTSEIIRAVREEKTKYIITYQGRPVGLLLPIDEEAPDEHLLQASKEAVEAEDVWAELERLSKEISAAWKSDKSAAELLSEMRR